MLSPISALLLVFLGGTAALVLPGSPSNLSGVDARHQIRLPWKDPDVKSFVSISFSIKYGTLLANDHYPIFPDSFPPHIYAPRYREHDSTSLGEFILTFRLDVSAETSYSFLKLIFQDELGHLATTEALLIDLIHDRNGNFAIDAIRLEPIELVVLDQWNGTAASSSYKRPWMRHDRIHDGGHPGGPEFLQRLRSAILPSLVGIMAGLLACTVGFALGWIGIAAYTCLACLVGRTKCRSGASKLGEVDEDEEEELSSEACVGSKMERALPWSPAL